MQTETAAPSTTRALVDAARLMAPATKIDSDGELPVSAQMRTASARYDWGPR
jgi:hypothetical protein